MSRKNSVKIRNKRHEAARSRALAQAKQLENRKKLREETRKLRMEEEVPVDADGKRPLKRKAQRRLENEMARLARKGIKLVKQDDEEVEMDDGDRPSKRMRSETK